MKQLPARAISAVVPLRTYWPGELWLAMTRSSFRREHGLDLAEWGVDGQHGPGIARGRGHQPAALAGQQVQVAAQDAGRTQRDQLTVAVAGEGVGRHAERCSACHAPRLTAPRAGWATSVARSSFSCPARTSGVKAGCG